MKKYITIALCLLLLIVLAVPTFAAEATKMTVTSSKTVVQRGETVDFTVAISGTTAFTSVVAEFTFDANVFEYVSSTTTQNGPMVDYDEVSIAVMSLSAIKYEGELLTITLRAKDTAPIKSSAITGSASGNNGELPVTFVGTTVNINCQHSYPTTWTKVDGEYHEKICSKCQTHDKQKHTWDDGELTSPPSCTNEGKEEYTCIDGCGATKTEKVKALGHSWDNACDKTCNRKDCGYTRETEHEYSASWKSDATGHWHECIKKCGSESDFAAHTPGPEATANDAQTCTVCKYEIAPKLEHVHSFGTEWNYDTENHWHRCETPASPDCYEMDALAPHDYDDACDISCNTCGYVRVAPHSPNGEWRASANGHWSVCTICNTDTPILDHVPGPEATQDTPQTCAECNFIIKMELSHVHDFGEQWYSDDTNHWQSCNDFRCPEVQSMEPHAWDEGEELPDGGFLYICSVCAKQMIMTEPMGTEPSTVPSTGAPTNPDASRPAEKEPKDAISWEWAGIAAIVLLIVGVVLLVIEFIRSRKTNMKGKFSK